MLLQQEGYLFHAALTQGLTALRNASLNKMGNFYVASFQLSIGLERALKVAHIVHHMIENEFSPPDRKQIKDYGHDITSLFDKAVQFKLREISNPLVPTVDGTIDRDILVCLSEFAKTTRYFNLDQIGARAVGRDPLVNWSRIFGRIMNEELSEARRRRIEREATAYLKMYSGNTLVIGRDMDKLPLDLASAVALPLIHEATAGHAVYHIILLLRQLHEFFFELTTSAWKLSQDRSDQALSIPRMDEFLQFSLHEKAVVLRKRSWS